MTGKTVEFKQPTRRRREQEQAADQWVADRESAAGEGEPMKRFTIDVPQSLHSRIKSKCALRGEKMADVIRALLQEQFPDKT